MNNYQCGRLFLIVLFATQFSVAQKILRIAKNGSAEYTSVQSAIEKAGPGDIIQIEDLSVYEEQLTIDSTKCGLVLRSKNPASLEKPIIKWQDTKNQLPKNYSQSQHSDSINYYKNGALRVLRAVDISINGIKIDGGGAAPFEWESVWNNKEPILHGNSAVNLWSASNVVIKNCEITNAYFGVYVFDGNQGGIFANSNPADIQPWSDVPLSGFGKTGNHIIENNRIHDNSWGAFFESAWDQGSIIRYNLFYENHHTSSVSTLLSTFYQGHIQPGGALLFKDVMLSPMAIHNNTFWHNRTSIAGHWQPGAHYLVFNNIVAQPDSLSAIFMSIDSKFTSRMHHCLYAAQDRKVSTRTVIYSIDRYDPNEGYIDVAFEVSGVDMVRVMNGMEKVEIEGMEVTGQIPLSTGTLDTTFFAEWVIKPGARITDFGSNSTVRWFEMKFLSTDTNSPDFLVPDWDDADVKRLVLDQGWPQAGIIDADGSVADIGAIPKGGRASSNMVIKASAPVMVDGTNANVTFNLLEMEKEKFKDVKIKYLKWINNVNYRFNAFGNDIPAVPASSVIDVNIPTETLIMGTNSIKITIPPRSDNEHYAFLEMIVEGKNEDGKTEISNVGFIPYRKLDHLFEVRVLDYATGKIDLDEVREGELVKLSITPKNVNGVPFDSMVSSCVLTLGSGFVLNSSQNDTLKIPEVKGTLIKDCYFTKTPSSGYDCVSIGGIYGNAPFFGSSKLIRILPDNTDVTALKKIPVPEIKIKLIGNKLFTNFSNSNSDDKFSLELFNIMGCRVAKYSNITAYSKQFNLDKLSSGLYYCVINFRGSVVTSDINLVR